MTSFPDVYQKVLSSELTNAKHVKVGNTPEYFVVHSTAGVLSDSAIKDYRSKGYRGKAHLYVMKSGGYHEVWPFSERKVWATKIERNKPFLVGKMLHIELNYKADEAPTRNQYETLADLYVEAVETYGPLKIVPHREVDRGLHDGHSDPTNFDFDFLYRLIQSRIGRYFQVGIDGITQARYEIPNQADQKSVWPPRLSGLPERTK
jgi:hypothetical protein